MNNTIEGFFKKYRFLSNFHEKEFTYKGKTFKSSEHAYQAYKAVNNVDFEYVRNCKTPSEARKAGKKIKCRPDFDKIKYNLMFEILMEKFKDEELKTKLLATGDAYLEGTNF
jgi:hypothetical protein